MEYSTSAPRRLPGIPLPGGADGCDSSSSHDSHDYREDASPVRTPYGGGVEGGYAPFDDDGDRSTEATPSKRARREEVPTPGPTPADLAGDRGRKSRPSSSKKKNPGQPDGVVISPTTLRLHEAAESLVASTPATAIERVESLVADSLGGIADALSWGGSRAGGSVAPGSSGDGADSLSGDSGDSSPDLPAFRSSASSAASSSLREGGEVVEQTAVPPPHGGPGGRRGVAQLERHGGGERRRRERDGGRRPGRRRTGRRRRRIGLGRRTGGDRRGTRGHIGHTEGRGRPPRRRGRGSARPAGGRWLRRGRRVDWQQVRFS